VDAAAALDLDLEQPDRILNPDDLEPFALEHALLDFRPRIVRLI
jgi:hypothetical protein